VLEPAELRRKMAEVAARMHETYGRVTQSPVEDWGRAALTDYDQSPGPDAFGLLWCLLGAR
jgi:hypothetical protein